MCNIPIDIRLFVEYNRRKETIKGMPDFKEVRDMSGIFSMLGGLAILIAGLVLGFLVLWLVFGRRKKGEDQAIGILETMSVFRGTTGSTNSRCR